MVSDADNDTLTYSAVELPPGASLNNSTGAFSWTPSYSQAGTYSVTFRVTDTSAISASETVTITVINVNQAPVLAAIPPKTVAEGANLAFSLSATDADSDTITYSASNLPAGATLDITTGAFSWTPDYSQAGPFSIIFTASDGNGGVSSQTAAITVVNTDRAPVLNPIGAKSVKEGATILFSVSASDPDNDKVTITASPLQPWMSFDGTNFIASPEYSNSGTYPITFTATDGSLTATETVSLTVSNTNRPPVLAVIGDKNGAENTLLTFTVTASDPDGDALLLSASNLPVGATFNPSTGEFSWTPSYSQAGVYTPVNFQVSDGTDTVSEAITITIANTNQPPVLGSIGSKNIKEQATLSFTVLATDPDGDTLTYSASPLPAGATFANRAFLWTPSVGQAGKYNVTFAASDDKGGTSSETVAISVNAIDLTPPYAADLTPAAGEVQVDRNTSVIINVKDDGDGVDKNTISVSILRKGDRAPLQIVKNGVSQLANRYPNAVIIKGTPADYMVKYDPPLRKEYRFSYEQDVTVYVEAQDISKNALKDYAYTFTTSMILRGANKAISAASGANIVSLPLRNAGFIKNAVADDRNAAFEVVSGITLDKHDAKNVYAVWHDESLDSIWTAKSTDRGKAFSTKTRVSSLTQGLNENPVITTDSAGNTYVAWQNQQAAGDWNLYFARRLAGTGTFEVAQIPIDAILGAVTEQTQPSIDANGDGKVSIAWVNNGNGNDGIYLPIQTTGELVSGQYPPMRLKRQMTEQQLLWQVRV